MSDTDSDIEIKFNYNNVDIILRGIRNLYNTTEQQKNSLLATVIVQTIHIMTELQDEYAYPGLDLRTDPDVQTYFQDIENYLKISNCVGHNFHHNILNIDWIIDNSISIDYIKKFILRIPSRSRITDAQKEKLQEIYNMIIRNVPELKKLKKYLKKVRKMTSEVLRPSDDPDFYDQGVNDLVGSFLFKGRKSRGKSGKRKSVRKYKRKSNISRKPKKSK